MPWRMFGLFAGFTLFFALFGILSVIFWVWMLIDCLQRRRFEDKLVWVLVLLFLNVLGAILYYLLVKSKNRR
jgi:uncharacterized membrane protein YphA (DoxX/SURF4 family)